MANAFNNLQILLTVARCCKRKTQTASTKPNSITCEPKPKVSTRKAFQGVFKLGPLKFRASIQKLNVLAKTLVAALWVAFTLCWLHQCAGQCAAVCIETLMGSCQQWLYLRRQPSVLFLGRCVSSGS